MKIIEKILCIVTINLLGGLLKENAKEYIECKRGIRKIDSDICRTVIPFFEESMGYEDCAFKWALKEEKNKEISEVRSRSFHYDL